MPMNSDRLIIGYCNINNALAGDCRKMWSFFFWSLIETSVFFKCGFTSVALSNVTTVKFFFFLYVNFTKSIIELRVLHITFMPVKFQNDQRTIAQ